MENILYFDGANGVNVRNNVRFAMQAVLRILSNFSSTGEMIRLVQECVGETRTDPLEIAVTDGSATSNFKTFMKFQYLKSINNSEDEIFAMYVIHACIAYETLMGCTEFEEKFPATSGRRFLVHLMTHLIAIFKGNNVLLREWNGGCDLPTMLSTDGFIDFVVALSTSDATAIIHACRT